MHSNLNILSYYDNKKKLYTNSLIIMNSNEKKRLNWKSTLQQIYLSRH